MLAAQFTFPSERAPVDTVKFKVALDLHEMTGVKKPTYSALSLAKRPGPPNHPLDKLATVTWDFRHSVPAGAGALHRSRAAAAARGLRPGRAAVGCLRPPRYVGLPLSIWMSTIGERRRGKQDRTDRPAAGCRGPP